MQQIQLFCPTKRVCALSPFQCAISRRNDDELNLDAAWYFHHLQQFGMHQMAELLIDEVMICE